MNDSFCFFLNFVGGGFITPKQGSVVGGKCVTTGDLPAEQVTLELKVAITFLFIPIWF